MMPLKNIKVLDLGKVIAGPICGQWLGDLGADVVKVEPVLIGDDTRAWPPHTSGESAIDFASTTTRERAPALTSFLNPNCTARSAVGRIMKVP